MGKQRNADCTVYVGELDTQVDEELLWELFLQVGPVVYVHIPKDRVTNQHSGFGFVEFKNEVDADYASKVLGGVKVPARVCASIVPTVSAVTPWEVSRSMWAQIYLWEILDLTPTSAFCTIPSHALESL